MKEVIESTSRDFAGVRTGRANPAILDRIVVDYYDTPTPLTQIASVSAPEPRLLVVTPWDKSVLGQIERAIQKSDIGLVPANDGNVIRMAIPHLTEERRRELVKLVRKMAEEKRINIRGVRRDAMDEVRSLEKEGTITEDELRRAQDEIQKVTDKYIAEIDDMLAEKEVEIMQV
ncbi:MAG: ribosome recycling factor [Firmicutes bacterium]|nr:ribosome recycling factor [Bacillota bacterium]MDD4336553.1 ribosome recycling factor [Bacillota bacterium]MDD4791817.1 ribosome recycling factor [Bacillota bacterium]